MIVQNAIVITENWPEVTYLVSSFRHDFKEYTFKNGKTIFVDGGRDYYRRGGSVLGTSGHGGYGVLWMEYCIDDNEPIYAIKKKLLWGTFGKNKKGPFKWVRLADCDVEHLHNILKTQPISPLYRKVIQELIDDAGRKDYKVIERVDLQTAIHKAKRPMYQYVNPTVCGAPLNALDAHKLSRTRWKNVTCSECLRLRNTHV